MERASLILTGVQIGLQAKATAEPSNKGINTMAEVIAIANHKGGVGKTCSASNIGAGLARAGHKTLIVDLDPQGNLSTSYGINSPEKTVYGALRKEYPIEPISAGQRLYIVPSDIDLSAAELELSAEPGREYILKETLEAVKGDYKYILIDCPPSLGLLTINGLTAADKLLIPLQPEFLALKGLTKLIEIVEKIQRRINSDLDILGIFLTRYDSRKTLNKRVMETVEARLPGKLFNTTIRNNIALAEAPAAGKDIFSYDPKSNGAEDYKALVSELLKKYKK